VLALEGKRPPNLVNPEVLPTARANSQIS
jgi:hypothetical protein